MTTSEVTDVDLQNAIQIFKDHPDGITRAQFPDFFWSDRRGRKIVQTIVEHGLLALITAPKEFGDGRGSVYRIARSAPELTAEDADLASRIIHLEKRRRGLKQAWTRQGMQPEQEALL
jgi:hypothetical protein